MKLLIASHASKTRFVSIKGIEEDWRINSVSSPSTSLSACLDSSLSSVNQNAKITLLLLILSRSS